MKKEIQWIIIVLILVMGVSALLIHHQSSEMEEKKNLKIGVSVYKDNDTFISSIMSDLEQIVKEQEQLEGITIKLDISDGKENQMNQNEQIERYISLGYDVICLNIVDRTDAATIIDKVLEANIPLIFFNREPVEEDLNRGEDIYYIGSDPKKSAVLQGELVLEAYKKNPKLIDTNANGIIEYAMLEGEVGHQDTIIRTEYSVKTLEENGLTLKKIIGGVANFDRSQATALVDQWIKNSYTNMELIICNNDDMALGAADGLAKNGINDISIVGIDGTPQGLEAVREGRLLGTVVADTKNYASTIFQMAYALGKGESIPDCPPIENGRYVWMPWRNILKVIENKK